MTTYYVPTASEVSKLAQSTIPLALAGTVRDAKAAIRLSVAALKDVHCTSLSLPYAEDSDEARQIIRTWNAIKEDNERFSFIFQKKSSRSRRPSREASRQTSWSTGPETTETALAAAFMDAFKKART